MDHSGDSVACYLLLTGREWVVSAMPGCGRIRQIMSVEGGRRRQLVL
jgi:hypothetical protein